MYVEPIFLKAEKGEIPELKQVIVSIGEKVAMEETLDEAIRKLVGKGVAVTPVSDLPPSDGTQKLPVLTADDVIRMSIERIDALKQKAREFDWAGFGAELEALERTLKSDTDSGEETAPESQNSEPQQ